MRVAILVPTFPNPSLSFTLTRARNLALNGVSVKLFYYTDGDKKLLDTPILESIINAGIEFQRLPRSINTAKSFVEFSKHAFKSFRFNKFFHYIHKSNDAGIPYIESIKNSLRVYPILFWQPDIIHFEISYLALRRMQEFIGMGTPIVVSLRGADVDEKPYRYPEWKHWYIRMNELPNVYFHCVSKHVFSQAARLGAKKSKCELIYQGVDKSNIQGSNIDEICVRRRDKVIIIARLNYEKGVDLAIQAIKLLRDDGFDLCLHIIGDGDKRHEYIELSQDLNIEKYTIFYGEKSNDWVNVFLHRNSMTGIYLQPSRREALGQSILEAMIARLPIIGANVGGIPELLEPDISGLLFPPEAHVDLAGYIKKLYLSPELAFTLGSNAYNRASKEFNGPKEATHFISFYQKIIAQYVQT